MKLIDRNQYLGQLSRMEESMNSLGMVHEFGLFEVECPNNRKWFIAHFIDQ